MNDPMFVVAAVLSIILAGLFVLLIVMDTRLGKWEKERKKL